jgi:hypothetical protein
VSKPARWKNLIARKDADAAAAELLATLGGLEGRFPRELAADLKQAQASGDTAAFEKLVADFEARPRMWLAREHFGW